MYTNTGGCLVEVLAQIKTPCSLSFSIHRTELTKNYSDTFQTWILACKHLVYIPIAMQPTSLASDLSLIPGAMDSC